MTNSVAYSEKLQHPKWQKKRLAILERDNYKCVYCEDGDTQLHIHHKKYSGDPWEIDDEHLETVCKYCHKVITVIKKRFGESVLHIAKSNNEGHNMVMSAITDERYTHIIFWQHGEIISQSIMADGVIKSIYDILFPKPLKTRKRKNGKAHD